MKYNSETGFVNPEPATPAPVAADQAQPTRQSPNPVLDAFRRSLPVLFVGNDGAPYAAVKTERGGVITRATYAIDSADFSDFLQKLGRDLTGNVPGDQVVRNWTGAIRFDARESGVVRDVYLRVASLPGRKLLDLGRPDRRVIEITPEGWQEVDCPTDVYFVRTPQVGAIDVTPVRGGNVNDLFRVVNIGPAGRPLVIAWLVSNFLGSGGFPILLLTGPQGSGKTIAARLIRMILDPSPYQVRLAPRGRGDVAAAVRSSWTLALDNLSSIPGHLSDELSAIATGTTFTSRRLHTNYDEAGVVARKPILLNGIPDGLVTRSDLASRVYHVELEPVARRRTEEELAREVRAVLPSVLGGILDMAVRGLATKPVDPPPVRLADAAAWAEACGVCPEPGQFAALVADRDRGFRAQILAQWPAAEYLVGLAQAPGVDGKTFTYKELLAALNLMGNEAARQDPDWPANERKLTADLSRYRDELADLGVRAEKIKQHKRDGNRVKLSYTPPAAG